MKPSLFDMVAIKEQIENDLEIKELLEFFNLQKDNYEKQILLFNDKIDNQNFFLII